MVSVKPEDTVLDAIKVLAREDIGAAVVMSGDRLAGIFSERDYTRKVVLKGRSSETTRVEEIMTANVICVSPRTKTPRLHGPHVGEEHPPPARWWTRAAWSAWCPSATS